MEGIRDGVVCNIMLRVKGVLSLWFIFLTSNVAHVINSCSIFFFVNQHFPFALT